ncbi:hypothetical protein QFC21_001100 [Naganishia friedmannii]|uniref:Uncharacterized protein n=1 Tax=Naganishia friedmannii TaxID=89922 RepID=A0ACC2W966_9TREE|nr:hypothetical protein QFC21_001100 [Naganishia friedmannii]
MPKSVPTSKAARKAQIKRLQQELADLSAERDNEEHEHEIDSDEDDDDDVDHSSSSSSSSSSAVEITPPPPPKKKQKVAKQDIPKISYKKVTVGSAAIEKMTGRDQPEHLKSRKLSVGRGVVRDLGKRIRFGSKNHSTIYYIPAGQKVFSAGVVGGSEANWMKSRKHGGELVMKERMSKQQLVMAIRDRFANPDTSVAFSAGPRGNFVFAKYHARTPLLSVEVLHIRDVATAADIQEFFAGRRYCFVFDDDWADVKRKVKLGRAEEKWLAEFQAVGEEAKAKLQKGKGKDVAGKKRKRGGDNETSSNSDEPAGNDPNAIECPECEAIMPKKSARRAHPRKVHSTRTSKVAVHTSGGRVSQKSQVKVKREMKRESEPDTNEAEYDERQEFCSWLGILCKANDAACTFCQEAFRRFTSYESNACGNTEQQFEATSNTDLNNGAGNGETQYLNFDPNSAPVPPGLQLDPVFGLLEYSDLMSKQYHMTESAAEIQDITDSGPQLQNHQDHHVNEKETANEMNHSFIHRQHQPASPGDPSWTGISAAGPSDHQEAETVAEGNSGGEDGGSDGDTEHAVGERLSAQQAAAALAFSDTIAGSVKRQSHGSARGITAGQQTGRGPVIKRTKGKE